ncbi:class I SAM-dependent methyltransferase [Leptospira ognonensis]|uniref:Class I SAM-dependent methyltransferase n=1 Tax=Leptospira ognonensis TaxID=2484945 RepID=A0A4R9JT29_9LEPT|nr:class I SAM-dependent methyltransferase [Leptospira ognonensis]TGL55882.1 class I SAM-dependent methyltransferase [Leptospira ognonensis]
MELIPCNTCGSLKFKTIYHKSSPRGETFSIVKCKSCELVQVNPQPNFDEVMKYYEDSYFTQRTDRGYDNYYSDKIKNEISRVFKLNLRDLGFFDWECIYQSTKTKTLASLDIGCAAGYFVDFMKNRGYAAEGIEIADGPVNFARNQLGLTIHKENFLSWDTDATKKYDLITLWATIEHLHQPKETLVKIKSHLNPGGTLIISTCRYGILAWWHGLAWRYLNVPEHLYYYSLSGLKTLLLTIGFKDSKSLSYGSGMTAKANAGFFFNLVKSILDRFVKITNQGDMMAIRVVFNDSSQNDTLKNRSN